ncbi:MAG: phosphoribosylanthranilate isomerase [Methanobrevibacter sp.]|jgi:phosphoribosylanthranilate isomerase|nr:phosphoribosylanthranilate isomerase [Candidatus Methanovirga meridionalis]
MKDKIKIKICGLRRLEDIEIVNKYKPDYVGFVFTESKRQVDFKQAKILKNKLDEDILVVGVFLNSDIDDIIRLIECNVIDMVQLHGDEDEEFVAKLKKLNNDIKIIKAIEIKDNDIKQNSIYDNEINIKKWEDSAVDYLLLDSGKGSGETFNWELIGDIKKPFFLAGGINSENIKKADKLHPFAIDLSSSVEENGFKSPKKIFEIMECLNEVNYE